MPLQGQAPQGFSGLSTTIGSREQQLASAYATTHLESMCELDIDSEPHRHRMTGIICTIGNWFALITSRLPVLVAAVVSFAVVSFKVQSADL